MPGARAITTEARDGPRVTMTCTAGTAERAHWNLGDQASWGEGIGDNVMTEVAFDLPFLEFRLQFHGT